MPRGGFLRVAAAAAAGALLACGAARAEAGRAKHDGNYRPAEVADALKKSGQGKGAPAP